jgi:polar amino acid transport system substrate-binding protein
MKKQWYLFSLVLVAAMLLASCAPAATPAPTTAPAQATATGAEATPGAGAPAVVATIAPENLVQKNHLLVCTDFPYPPQEFFDENGNPQGVDIDLGNEIGARLGLQVQYVNSVFDTIIAAVTSGKCDVAISAMNITTERSKQISQIPYFEAGQSFVTVKGNPHKITGEMDLCGQPVAAESGTTEVDYLQGTGDYQDKGLSQKCTAAGKQAVNVVITQKDSDALQQLQANKVIAYSTDSPVAAYYTVEHPDQFEVVGQIVEPVKEGIGVPCGQADCTNAPLTPVGQAVKAALDSMRADGTYEKILSKWNLTNSAVTE